MGFKYPWRTPTANACAGYELRHTGYDRRAVRLMTLMLATGSGIVVIGSLLWAWATDEFWESVPLYPCVAAAGILAGLALLLGRRSLVRAAAFAVAISLVTLLGTAVITLARWGN